MFDKNELDALAKQAKEKLKEQNKDNYNEDIYSEFSENSNIENNNTTGSIDVNDYSDRDLSYSEYIDEPSSIESLKQYDEVLFPGGPTKLEVDMWKKDWDGYSIYITEILDQPFIFRTLNRFEYKQLVAMQNTDALLREEIICQTVTLYPSEYNWKAMSTSLAGIPSTYAEIIMEKSGFTKDIAIQVL